MSSPALRAPLPSAPERTLAPARPRMLSLDIIRGAVMALMAVDHVRVYFAAEPLAGLNRISAGLFLTRWVTHFCAPAFLFLAGTGAWFYGRRVMDRSRLARFLATRGLWLVLLEMTVIRFGWTFNLQYDQFVMAGVIWVIGLCMLLMAALVWLPTVAIGAVGLALTGGHNLLDPLVRAARQAGPDGAGWLARVLYVGGPIPLGPEGPVFAVLYAVVPWIGVMASGYAFGAVLERPAEQRRRLCFQIGLGAIAAFLVLRGLNLYGNPTDWSAGQRSPLFALFSFIDTAKYPASLLFLLMTLGPVIALIPVLETARGRLALVLAVFGRVPLFYYLLHIPLIHALAVGVAWLRQGGLDPWLFANHPLGVPPTPDGLGVGVAWVWLISLLVVAILYPPCRRFADLKTRRTAWWLSLL